MGLPMGVGQHTTKRPYSLLLVHNIWPLFILCTLHNSPCANHYAQDMAITKQLSKVGFSLVKNYCDFAKNIARSDQNEMFLFECRP